MGGAYFVRNALIELDGVEYLLFRKVRVSVWQLENIKDHSIIEREESALYRALGKRKLRFISLTIPQGKLTKIELSEAEQALSKGRREYVLAVTHVPNTRAAMEKAIDAVWERTKWPEKKPSWTTVYRWKVAYYRANGDGRALLNCKPGRTWRVEIYGPIVLGICDDAIDEIYMIRERGTIEATLNCAKQKTTAEQRLLDEAYDKDLAAKAMARPILKPPTRRLIRRLIGEIPEFDKYAARFGHEAAMMKFRSCKGNDLASEPLEQFELDHTLLDLFVVDDETGLPCGRPHITACIDNYTRCIMGLCIGFGSTSGLSVALCLKDAFLPKEWREMYPEIKNDCPSGVCERLKVDNGLEMHGTQLEQACLRLGIIIDYTPRKRAWYKGKIERLFRTLNGQIAHGTRGTTFSNIIQKGDYNPEHFATVRLSVLRKEIRRWVADVYHQRRHRSLGISPSRMWEESMRSDLLRVPPDARELDVVMGRPYRRKLTHKGIEFANMQYNSEALKELRYREGSDLWVDIRVDEENLGRLWVAWNNTEILEARPFGREEYAEGLTKYQHDKIQEARRLLNLPDNDEGWIEAMEQVRQAFIDEYQLTARRRRGLARLLDSGEKAAAEQAPADEPPAKKPPQSVPGIDTNAGAPRHFAPIIREERHG